MRRWIMPAIVASFAGTLLVGTFQSPAPLLTFSRTEGALPSEASASIAAPGEPQSLTELVTSSITAAAVTCPHPSDDLDAEQVLVVHANGTRATVIGCTLRASRNSYRRTLGPVPARVGYNGVAAPGKKREGDGRTPIGTFRLGKGFGTAATPGLRQGWLRVGARDVWVDDSRSALYNTHQSLPAKGRWHSAERLKIPAYRYAQVIGYNTGRIPDRGSAIFMHVGTTPTAGCVALRARDLISIMRWERPGAVVTIS